MKKFVVMAISVVFLVLLVGCQMSKESVESSQLEDQNIEQSSEEIEVDNALDEIDQLENDLDDNLGLDELNELEDLDFE